MEPNRRNRRDNRDQKPVEEKQFDERVVSIDRVARVVKGGRRFRFRALLVIGDKKGRVGIGIAKGGDVQAAVTKAVEMAKKNIVNVPIHNGTLPHEAQAKVAGANIFIKPASPGTGLIAGGVVRTVLEVSGYSNALSKSLGSSNKINSAYATLEALKSIAPSSEWIVQPVKTSKGSQAHNSVKPAKEVKAEAPAKEPKEVKSEKPAKPAKTAKAAK